MCVPAPRDAPAPSRVGRSRWNPPPSAAQSPAGSCFPAPPRHSTGCWSRPPGSGAPDRCAASPHYTKEEIEKFKKNFPDILSEYINLDRSKICIWGSIKLDSKKVYPFDLVLWYLEKEEIKKNKKIPCATAEVSRTREKNGA